MHGRAIGGFAVVAYPAKYGSSGIMTFIVNQDGKVFQADLGPDTQARQAQMKRFDPGKGWSPVSATKFNSNHAEESLTMLKTLHHHRNRRCRRRRCLCGRSSDPHRLAAPW